MGQSTNKTKAKDKKGDKKVEKTMHEFKHGELRSSSGHKIKSRKQAVAIALDKKRRAGGNVPKKKS